MRAHRQRALTRRQIARFVINGGSDKWGELTAGDESRRVSDALALVAESNVQGEEPLLQLEVPRRRRPTPQCPPLLGVLPWRMLRSTPWHHSLFAPS